MKRTRESSAPIAVYSGRKQIGVVYATDQGFVAKDASGNALGQFQKEQAAIIAVLEQRAAQ